MINILSPNSKPLTLGIIYGPPNQSNFLDDINIALEELAFQRIETYYVLRTHTQNLKRLSETKDC